MTAADLIKRLEDGEGADRKLDGDIHIMFISTPEWRYATRGLWSPAYTSSLDACIALAEKVLPGWQWHIRSPIWWLPSPEHRAYMCKETAEQGTGHVWHKDKCRAFLIALIKAKEEKP